MTAPAAARFFDAIAARYDRVYAPPASESRRRMKRVLAALPAGPQRVLDLGVGTGRELASLFDAGHQPIGVDASGAMLERCARRARALPLVQADFWRAPLPFSPGAFDAAIALHGTLAHPPDASAVGRLARELARIVRPGGRLAVETPTPAWLDAAAARPQPGDRRVIRTGPGACVIEDRVVGASIEARLLDEDQWMEALRPDWRPEVRPIGKWEWLVVAERLS
jgi:SAM-dependent methyltransferase